MPVWFGEFARANPDVDLRLHEAELSQVQALIEQGEADLGFGFFTKASHGIERTLLQSFRLMRVTAGAKRTQRTSPKAGKPITWDDLRDERLIGLPPDNPIQQLVEAQLARIDRADEPRAAFRRFETLIGMAEAGMGTAVMPTFALPACRQRDVRWDVLARPEVTLGFHRIVKRGRAKPELWRQFTELVTTSLQRIDAMADGGAR
jgi:DNA-binding transcriptional LysR family regulator